MDDASEHLKKARRYAFALAPLRNLGLSLIALVACGFFVLVNVFSYLVGTASEGWPAVQGRILKSEVSETTGKSGRSYRAEVVYAYEVNGEVYEGDNISYGGGMSSKRSEMDLLVSDFIVGKSVPVYYNPKEPEEACLLKGVNKSSLLIMGAFGVGLVVSLRKLLTSGRELKQMMTSFSQV